MSNNVLEIRDKDGREFRMKIITTSTVSGIRLVQDVKEFYTRGGWFGGVVTGEWKTKDEGFIRFRFGKTRTRFSYNGDLTTSDLLILGSEGIKTYDGRDFFGMQLFEFESIWGVNDQGGGIVIQPWVVALTPGRISWRVVG